MVTDAEMQKIKLIIIKFYMERQTLILSCQSMNDFSHEITPAN